MVYRSLHGRCDLLLRQEDILAIAHLVVLISTDNSLREHQHVRRRHQFDRIASVALIGFGWSYEQRHEAFGFKRKRFQPGDEVSRAAKRGSARSSNDRNLGLVRDIDRKDGRQIGSHRALLIAGDWRIYASAKSDVEADIIAQNSLARKKTDETHEAISVLAAAARRDRLREWVRD